MNIPEWEWIARIMISGLLSGIIGWEREKHGREAGLRTIILVGTGTAAIMVTSLRVYELFAGSPDPVLRLDPARIAYGVVTGIGFLGAGAIIKDAKKIRGLTTAACLWLVTSVSLATGCGFYSIALVTTLLSLLTLYMLKRLEHRLERDVYNQLIVTTGVSETALDSIKQAISGEKLEILSLAIEKNLAAGISVFTLHLRHKGDVPGEYLLQKLSGLPDIKDLKWK